MLDNGYQARVRSSCTCVETEGREGREGEESTGRTYSTQELTAKTHDVYPVCYARTASAMNALGVKSVSTIEIKFC